MRLRGNGFLRAAPWALLVVGIAGAVVVVQVPPAPSPPISRQQSQLTEPTPPSPTPPQIGQWLTAQPLQVPSATRREPRREATSPQLAEKLSRPLELAGSVIQPTNCMAVVAATPVENQAIAATGDIELLPADVDLASRDKNARIRLSRYDREVTRAAAQMLAPALLPSAEPPAPLTAPTAIAASFVEPSGPDIMPLLPDAESLTAVRKAPAQSAGAIKPTRLQMQANPPRPIKPPATAAAVALRPNAPPRPASPPPRLSVVVEQSDGPTLRIKP